MHSAEREVMSAFAVDGVDPAAVATLAVRGHSHGDQPDWMERPHDAGLCAEIEGVVSARLSLNDIRAVLACMSAAVLRPMLVRGGLCGAGSDDRTVLRTYFERSEARAFSPCVLFDEGWYLRRYPDVERGVGASDLLSGFVHFVVHGLREGRWPNAIFESMAVAINDVAPRVDHFDEAAYVSSTPYAQAFLRCFPVVGAAHYYERYGRMLGDRPLGHACLQSFRDLLAEFDADYYAATYMAQQRMPVSRDAAFDHYVTVGLRAGHSPNAWFDEAWYRAFYADVRRAIGSGALACGFQHYVLGGRSEQRLPRFELSQALEVRLPGVTRPTLMQRTPDLEQRLTPGKVHLVREQGPRFWFIMPWINPDIAFGGHIAALELILALHRGGYAVGIMCTQDPKADKEYFIWRETRAELRALMQAIPVLNLQGMDSIPVGADDAFIVYSVWDLRLGAQLAGFTRRAVPMLLTQEYEPAFHSNSSVRLLCERAYDIPHFPIINSPFLRRYLQAHAIGPFRSDNARDGRDYAVFEHRVAPMPRQTARALAERSTRTLVAYARPEAHAERNLFEILLIALRRACAKGVFGPQWRFVGVGALTAIEPITLGPNQALVMRQKMTEAEYHEHVQSVDIGVSLMYAPHPSVVPFELATTGAIVVTNTYENRSAADLARICENIVPAAPSIEGVVAALEEAVARAEQFAAREARAYDPPVTRWEQSFSPTFLARIFGDPLGRGDALARGAAASVAGAAPGRDDRAPDGHPQDESQEHGPRPDGAGSPGPRGERVGRPTKVRKQVRVTARTAAALARVLET